MPPRLRTPLFLLLLTAAAAVLRFTLLGQPTLWGDEALVYWRTCGSLADLLAVLPSDGFPPLHYELYWTFVHGRVPSPAVMRLVPATCGTLMVPAVYFLSRQLVSRRASRFAAVLTAGSAFGLFYSRDAKMYAEAWLAMTASVACLLWWARTGRATAWLGWVAGGAVAAGLQVPTLVPVLGLGPLVILTGRRAHWRGAVLWVAGAAAIGAGPAGYYGGFNHWKGNGLEWVAVYNAGRSGPAQVGYLATTFATGWEWPGPPITVAYGGVPPAAAGPFWGMPARRAEGLIAMTALVALAVAAGAVPWPPRWVPADDGSATEPPWRATLWIASWAVLPTYAVYCQSVAGFAAPSDWLQVPGVRWPLLVAAAVAVGAVAYRPTRSTAARWLTVAAVLLVVVGACQGIAAAVRASGRPASSVWVPRYLGFVWPAVIVAVAAVLSRVPTAVGRWSAVSIVVGANLGMFAYRLAGTTEPPVDLMAADVWAAQPRDGRPAGAVVWSNLPYHPDWQSGPAEGRLFGDVGRYYLQRLARREPMTPDAFRRSLSTFVTHNADDDDDGGEGAADVASWLAAHPGVRQLTVWEHALWPASPPDVALPLPRGWHRSSDERWTVRNVWTGRDVARYRRRVYAGPPMGQGTAGG